MPAKTKRDEEKWQKAKEVAQDQGKGENYAYIMGIYKKMDPDYFKSAADHVVKRWLFAKDPLRDLFIQQVYPNGIENPDVRNRKQNPTITVETYERKGKAARQFIRAQFEKWKKKREMEGPPGQAVEDLGSLEEGQTLEWIAGKQVQRGTVVKARPNRAILKMEDGSTQHLRAWDVEKYQPRILD
jgi:hypothetical protein